MCMPGPHPRLLGSESLGMEMLSLHFDEISEDPHAHPSVRASDIKYIDHVNVTTDIVSASSTSHFVLRRRKG